jgi:hypothetical protein
MSHNSCKGDIAVELAISSNNNHKFLLIMLVTVALAMVEGHPLLCLVVVTGPKSLLECIEKGHGRNMPSSYTSNTNLKSCMHSTSSITSMTTIVVDRLLYFMCYIV